MISMSQNTRLSAPWVTFLKPLSYKCKTFKNVTYILYSSNFLFKAACRMIGLLQATSVFVSTITITAIALDRRRLIVGSEQESPKDMGKMVASIPLIWGTALTMARYKNLFILIFGL